MLNAWSKIWCLYTFAIESQKAMQYKCLVNMGQTFAVWLGCYSSKECFWQKSNMFPEYAKQVQMTFTKCITHVQQSSWDLDK